MTKIIVINNMFDKDQNILVYKDNQMITSVNAELDELVDVVKSLASQYSIRTIDLVGNENFLTQFKNNFLSEFNQYTVNIIPR